MRNTWQTGVGTAAIILLSLTATGCVTSKKYKMVKKDAERPAAELKLTTGAEATAVTLQTVIVFKGPGSWKREARWDEYVVAIANRGAGPLVIEEAVLIDPLGQLQMPGADPWKLEKLSYTNWDKYGKTGLKLLAGAGAVSLYAGAVVASTLGGLMAPTAAAGGGVVLLSVIPVVAVVDITAVAIMNSRNKKKVVAEFNRRRWSLPLNIPEGSTVAGSLFFPMTPSPQQLTLRGRRDGQPVDLVIDLKPLAALHLKPGEKR